MARRKPPELSVRHVLDAVERIAPPHLAEEWDNVGLQVGDPNAPAGRILVALEVSDAVLDEARRHRISTLVTHHPLIFRPLKSLATTATVPRYVDRMIRGGVALVAAHTNLDSVPWGTNGILADSVGIDAAGREILFPARGGCTHVKYIVYTPQTHVEPIIAAMARAGAGVIGNYTHCTFRMPGTGTYRPGSGATPFKGTVGSLEQADEVRLECVCPRDRLRELIEQVRAVHPYEEIALDVIPLETPEKPRHGFGLVGPLKKPSTIGALATLLKRRLGSTSIGVVGDVESPIRSAAVFSGSGGEAVRRWRDGMADVLVTGEMTHHDCAEARDRGINVLLVGHYESEAIVAARLAHLLRLALAEKPALKADVLVSQLQQSPLQRI